MTNQWKNENKQKNNHQNWPREPNKGSGAGRKKYTLVGSIHVITHWCEDQQFPTWCLGYSRIHTFNQPHVFCSRSQNAPSSAQTWTSLIDGTWTTGSHFFIKRFMFVPSMLFNLKFKRWFLFILYINWKLVVEKNVNISIIRTIAKQFPHCLLNVWCSIRMAKDLNHKHVENLAAVIRIDNNQKICISSLDRPLVFKCLACPNEPCNKPSHWNCSSKTRESWSY